MAKTAKEKDLMTMMRTLLRFKVIEEQTAAMILCLLETDEQREQLMQFMENHPEAGKQELYKKTLEIIKAERVEPDQI